MTTLFCLELHPSIQGPLVVISVLENQSHCYIANPLLFWLLASLVSFKEFFDFLVVDVDLLGVMRLLKEFVNGIFVSLLNVKFDQVGLKEGSNVPE
jgi:hypothetical protein